MNSLRERHCIEQTNLYVSQRKPVVAKNRDYAQMTDASYAAPLRLPNFRYAIGNKL